MFDKRNVGLVILLIVFVSLQALTQNESYIAFDRGHYGLNFSNLQEVKWQLDRHYQVYVGTNQDVDILRNVLVETSQDREEELKDVQVVVKAQNRADTTYGLSAFNPQPFDATTMDHLLVLEKLEVGDTIDVKYRVASTPSTNTHRWTLQYDFPVRESQISILLPEVFSYVTKVTDEKHLLDQSVIDSTLRIDRGKIKLKGQRYLFKNIPAFKEEPYAPQPIASRPACLFTLTQFSLGDNAAYLPDWPEQMVDLAVSDVFGKQYRIKSNYRWLMSEANDILTEKYAPKLKLLKLYQWIHQQFTWDGSYGLIPSYGIDEMQFEKTVNKSALNMALLALLNEADYRAYPVLVATSDQPPVQKEIPDINQFNHFVIGVDLESEKVYIDAGEPTMPLGWIDSEIRKNQAVKIQNLRGNWIALPEFSAVGMLLVNMKVNEDLSASGTIHASFRGYDAFNERFLLQQDRSAQYWKTRASSLSTNVRVDSVRFEHVTNLMEPFENTVYFHLDGATDSDELMINPVFYSFFSGTYFTDTSRQNTIELPFSIIEQCVINMDLAPSLQASYSEPTKLILEGGKGTVEFHASQKEQIIQSRFKAILPETSYPSTFYRALKVFFDSAQTMTQQPIIIRSGSGK